MDQETTIRFRLALELEKHRILSSAKASLVELLEKTTETTGDECDQARNMAEQHISLRLKDRERLLLHKIEEALERIKEGTFGDCMDCGREIAVKRLEIRPVATLCVRCKEKEERKEKAYCEESRGP